MLSFILRKQGGNSSRSILTDAARVFLKVKTIEMRGTARSSFRHLCLPIVSEAVGTKEELALFHDNQSFGILFNKGSP